MHLLIKNTTIISPGDEFNGQTRDILLKDGGIAAIDTPNQVSAENIETIDGTGTYTTPGFMDLRAHFADPGLEQREDLNSGVKAAAAGGFTGVALLPSTNPPVHSKSEVEYIINKVKDWVTDVYPMGCITHNREGKDLAEMFDMHSAGAVAFTDGNKPVKDSGLMHRAMLYAKGFNGLLCVHAEDTYLTAGGQMHEGPVSTHLGMKGMPNLSEYLAVKRDIELARYNNTRLHFSHVSAAESVELIRSAKSEGLQITADAAIANLVWDDSTLEHYDTNYKVNPPLRNKTDIEALLKGLEDGTIDAICSDHIPQEIENKAVEFDYAAFGMIGLQTFLPLLIRLSDRLGWEKLVNATCNNPRKILGLATPGIKAGREANITVFNPTAKWMFNRQANFSKSVNSPLFNTELTGKVILVANNNLAVQF
ncbi:MAG TPA: dihydroorotase [Bacteroidia bacterium]|nr:dihydroorotase [Bacteroidia bacterium]